jgi:glycosyltransferase involved in cell wall biosynthesis
MLVTIIIPTYNAAAYLARALDSALTQTYPHTEIICVDNNSTDHTLELLKQYQSRFPEKIQVLQEFEQGAPAARNLGLAHAKGEWVQFLDADDELLPGKIERQVRIIFESERNIDLIVGSFLVVQLDLSKDFILPVDCDNNLISLFLGRLGNTVCNFWKKHTFEKYGSWEINQKSGQEYELMLRWIRGGIELVYDQEFNTIVYKRANSLSAFSKSTLYANVQFRIILFDAFSRLDLKYLRYKDEIDIKMFKLIRDYGFFDIKDATRIFNDIFPKGFKPPKKMIERSFYIFFSLLGFSKATIVFKYYLLLKQRVI